MMLGLVKKIMYRVAYRLRLLKPEVIGRRMGAKIGDNGRILADPFSLFGSEPYLITIGDHVEITNGCRFITHDGSVWVMRENEESSNIDFLAPIRIGNNVFIGMDSIILPGVSVGNNVVVGAGSVVAKDIPSNTVCAGCPARAIRSYEDYANRMVSSEFSFLTKGMTSVAKEAFLRKERPNWFAPDCEAVTLDRGDGVV